MEHEFVKLNYYIHVLQQDNLRLRALLPKSVVTNTVLSALETMKKTILMTPRVFVRLKARGGFIDIPHNLVHRHCEMASLCQVHRLGKHMPFKLLKFISKHITASR